MTQEKKLEVMFYGNLAFWNFYVMGATEIDFGGIAHVKVGVWDLRFEQCAHLTQ